MHAHVGPLTHSKTYFVLQSALQPGNTVSRSTANETLSAAQEVSTSRFLWSPAHAGSDEWNLITAAMITIVCEAGSPLTQFSGVADDCLSYVMDLFICLFIVMIFDYVDLCSRSSISTTAFCGAERVVAEGT